MSNLWHKIETDAEAEIHSQDFWSRHHNELQADEFWADKIKKLRGEPVKRLILALENMPLPASFREAAIATRALIREKRKKHRTYDDELALLYWLAAINSFSIPYSKVLEEPGYNVIESIPGKKLKELPFSYKSLGYEYLELLNKTDIKWLIENWGEPNEHTTLHKMHNDLWVEYESKLKEKKEDKEEELINAIRNSGNIEASLSSPLKSSTNNKNNKWLISAVILLVFLIVAAFAG